MTSLQAEHRNRSMETTVAHARAKQRLSRKPFKSRTDPDNCDILFLNLVEWLPLMQRPFGYDSLDMWLSGELHQWPAVTSPLKRLQPWCHSGGHRWGWGHSPWFPPNSEKSDPALGSPWNALPVYRLLSPARGSLLCPKEYLGIDLQSNSKTGVHLHQSTKNKFRKKTNYFSTNTEYTESLKTLNTGQRDH